jgi:hypothetical protein
MATTLQFRRGNTATAAAVTGAIGEIYIDTDKKTIRVHDGSTAGGNLLISAGDTGTVTNTMLAGSIANAKLSNSAITINGTSVSLGGTRTLVTDDIGEDGSPVNLWYTDARARASVSVTDSGGDGSLTYNNSTGVFTYTGPSATEVRAHFTAGTGITITSGTIATTITQYTDALARSAVSVTDSGGDGSLAYNSSTGVFTYTGPSATEVRAHFTAGTGITITSGTIATTITQYTDALAKSAVVKSAPASATAAGAAGDIAYDADFIYVCIATDTWKRAPIATWP